MEKYDLIVIGAGSAGTACAEKTNKSGLRVALIEKNALGGTCLNDGCDPTKTALHSAFILHWAKKGQDYGLEIPEASVDWDALKEHIRAVQQEFRGGTEAEARESMRQRGIDLIIGEASLVSKHEVQVKDKLLQAENILIATGAEPVVLDVPGLVESGFITNQDVFDLPLLPKTLAIMGGGPIGVEFAQLFSRLGTEVQLFEPQEQILPADDPQLAAELTEILVQEGVQIHTQAAVTAVSPSESGKKLTISIHNGYEEVLEYEELLLAAGRTQAIAGLNLAEIGVVVEDKQIKTDEALRTTVPNIWSAGDVTSNFPFTHVAWRQGAHVAKNIIKGEARPFKPGNIPWVTYTDPELAHIGKLAAELDEANVKYREINLPMHNVARAVATGRQHGRIKLFVAEDGQILGGHILAANGGELIGPIVMAMESKLPITAVGDTVWPYPTMSEVLGQAANKRSR
jgi:pyruvate/2-oxoglutarate dehydrogenase complex dihydrolipoamide dehydrogenase (E3) component